VQFLEAKGLTAPEIEDAIRQAGSNQVTHSYRQPYQASYTSPYGPSPYGVPPSNQWDWRDYFITAVLTGTVAFGVVSLFQKYLLPNLRPPAATAYEEDRDALTAQFDKAEALLKEIQAETAAVRSAVEEQKERVDKTTQDVEAVVQEMRDGESKKRDEMREIRDEVNTIREMLPKMIEKNKDSQTQSLAELQQELKSLKALLLSRGTGSSTAPTSPFPFPGRPSIPAWQLAGASQTNGVHDSGSNQTVSLPSPIPVIPPVNGKGKEVEVVPEASSSS
jgi:peroxin-14